MKPLTLEKKTAPAAKEDSQPTVRPSQAPARSQRTRVFNVYGGDEYFEVAVDPVQTAGNPLPVISAPSASPAPTSKPASEPEVAPVETAGDEAAIVAPLPGIILRYLVEVGQSVQDGDPVLVLEAMKMENTLPSPLNGTVKSLPLEPGTTVAKDAVLAIIAP